MSFNIWHSTPHAHAYRLLIFKEQALSAFLAVCSKEMGLWFDPLTLSSARLLPALVPPRLSALGRAISEACDYAPDLKLSASSVLALTLVAVGSNSPREGCLPSLRRFVCFHDC